jgi:hypothetical protein
LRRSLESTPYLSIRYTDRLKDARIELSVGSVGDAYDNALAETIHGLYQTEVIRHRGPWRNLQQVEFATLEWVDWFNHRRPLSSIGDIPPAELEAMYFAANGSGRRAVSCLPDTEALSAGVSGPSSPEGPERSGGGAQRLDEGRERRLSTLNDVIRRSSAREVAPNETSLRKTRENSPRPLVAAGAALNASGQMLVGGFAAGTAVTLGDPTISAFRAAGRS